MVTRSVPPEAIRWFELLFFGSLMLRATEIPTLIAALSNGLMAVLGAAIGLFFSLLLPLWLALLVAQTRNNGAKWGLILLLALTILLILAVVVVGQGARLNILAIPAALLQAAAIALLFTASGRRWLNSKDTPSTEADLRGTFD